MAPKQVFHPAKPKPKDLTDTLLQNNLNQLNKPMTKSTSSEPNYAALQSQNSWGNTTPTNGGMAQNQSQWGGLAITTGSQTTVQSPSTGWSANGMSSTMNWGAHQPTPSWNQAIPIISQNINQNWPTSGNSGMRQTWRPDTGVQSMSQPLVPPPQPSTDLSSQDIMDLLS